VDRIGRREIGKALITCSCVPEEIVTAAGLQPVRLLPSHPPADADAHIHPQTCGYLKSLLAAALDEKALDVSCVVIGNGCDGMRKLYDLWGAYARGVPALFLDVPRKNDAESVRFFASELRRFAGKLEATLSGTAVTEERLHGAIEKHNQVRLLMQRVFELQREEERRVDGSDVFDLCMEGTRCSPEEFIPRLEGLLSRVEERGPRQGERRILLTGNVISRPDPVTIIEDFGGRVVALDTCIGIRHYQTLVEEKAADPVLALATRYLRRPSCPRMEGLRERFDYLKTLADACQADGIVYSCVKFCDPLIYDIPLMSSWFRDAGVPFLYLENDYTWSGSGQLRTRVQAFTELQPQ
jgi:benzoyl-CoA reductase/2-hydroxyglutaryl-CoA dehydratase subunit BcrC/BadD/HgdB